MIVKISKNQASYPFLSSLEEKRKERKREKCQRILLDPSFASYSITVSWQLICVRVPVLAVSASSQFISILLPVLPLLHQPGVSPGLCIYLGTGFLSPSRYTTNASKWGHTKLFDRNYFILPSRRRSSYEEREKIPDFLVLVDRLQNALFANPLDIFFTT